MHSSIRNYQKQFAEYFGVKEEATLSHINDTQYKPIRPANLGEDNLHKRKLKLGNMYVVFKSFRKEDGANRSVYDEV